MLRDLIALREQYGVLSVLSAEQQDNMEAMDCAVFNVFAPTLNALSSAFFVSDQRQGSQENSVQNIAEIEQTGVSVEEAARKCLKHLQLLPPKHGMS